MTKIFFAGADNTTHQNVLKKVGVEYLLMSFYNLNKMKNVEKVLTKFKGKEILLDSGAHTLQKGKNKIDYDLFVDEYIAFLKKYKDYFTYFVELDIENIVGLKKVEEWRAKITKEVEKNYLTITN